MCKIIVVLPHKDCSCIEKVEILLVKDEYSDDGH